MPHIHFQRDQLTFLSQAHLQELSQSLRAADRRELWAMYRLPAREGLALCWKHSVQALTFMYDGRVAACAGISPREVLGREACVWSWSGEEVERCPKAFFRASQTALAYFYTLYPDLYAVCDVRYGQARRYLRHLGARPTGEKWRLAGAETSFLLYRFTQPDREKINEEKEKLWVEF